MTKRKHPFTLFLLTKKKHFSLLFLQSSCDIIHQNLVGFENFHSTNMRTSPNLWFLSCSVQWSGVLLAWPQDGDDETRDNFEWNFTSPRKFDSIAYSPHYGKSSRWPPPRASRAIQFLFFFRSLTLLFLSIFYSCILYILDSSLGFGLVRVFNFFVKFKCMGVCACVCLYLLLAHLYLCHTCVNRDHYVTTTQ